MTASPLAVVLKGYPRLSETFIAQEIRNLELAGFEVTIYSLRHPTDKKRHPVHDEIVASVNYLPEYLYQAPLRVLRGWRRVRKLSGYALAFKTFWRDWKRDRTSNRVRRFGQALVLANELPQEITRLYAHFLHTPASVTRYAAMMRGLPWACSAHAKDIYTSPDWELKEKLEDCSWLTTCTRHNVEHLSKLTASPDKVQLNYHGLDLRRFRNGAPSFSDRDGNDAGQPVIILSVGRAVEKKGYAGLLNALALIDKQIHWRFLHIGGGPLLDRLKQQADALGISDNMEWLGSQSQEAVITHYLAADIFVLNSCIDASGDRDGLPNVLVEAQSQGLPVIATTISGIPELVESEVNGILVESGDRTALLEGLQQLITSPELRRQLGKVGQQKVLREFDMDVCFERLNQMLRDL